MFSMWRLEKRARVVSMFDDVLAAGRPVATIADAIDTSLMGAGEGLLTLGRAMASTLLAARASLRAVQDLLGPLFSTHPNRRVPP
jgi:hypothetical protein